jgi:copper(I)-binding protein
MKNGRLIVVLAVFALAFAACSSGGDSVEVEDPWGRPSPSSAANAAFYMQLEGAEEDDVLVSATSPACGMVELHETQMSDGVMSMQHLPQGIPVPAGETVSLEPGGLHVMCMGVQSPLTVGEMVEVALEFENSGSRTIEAEIREG